MPWWIVIIDLLFFRCLYFCQSLKKYHQQRNLHQDCAQFSSDLSTHTIFILKQHWSIKMRNNMKCQNWRRMNACLLFIMFNLFKMFCLHLYNIYQTPILDIRHWHHYIFITAPQWTWHSCSIIMEILKNWGGMDHFLCVFSGWNVIWQCIVLSMGG